MLNVLRLTCNSVARHNLHKLKYVRALSVTPSLLTKEVIIQKEGNVTVIEAQIRESPRVGNVLNLPNQHNACPLCKLNLYLRYTDILILSQFIDNNGNLLPRNASGVCKKQYRFLGKLVEQAQYAGLLPGFNVHVIGKPDDKVRWKWERHNTYYETPEELKWKQINTRENSWWEKPKKKIMTLRDIL